MALKIGFDLRCAIVFASIVLLASCATPTKPPEPPAPQPPVAAMHPFEVQSPNGVRVDNYYWLRDDTRTKPEMLDYLKAENAYYAAMTEHTKANEDALYTEIVGRIKQDDASVPAKYRHFYYYSRFVEGKEYPIYARKRGSLDAAEQILLDGNELASGHDYFQVANQEISPSEQILAYADDTVGRRQYTIHFKASFTPGAPHEGEFDFDPSKLDAAAAVDAYMHDHIAKSDRDVAP